MNYQQLQARIRLLASYAGWADSSPPPDFGSLANQAYQELAWFTEYNIETDTFETVVDQAEYDLATETTGERLFKFLSEAWYGTDTALAHTTESEISRRNRSWLFAESGTPYFYWTSTSGVLRLYPPPSAVETITIRGPRPPVALVAGTDTPTCPEVFHEAIALKGVLLLAEAFTEDEVDFARLRRYEERYDQLASALRRWAGDDDAEFQRHVAPRYPARTPFTLNGR